MNESEIEAVLSVITVIISLFDVNTKNLHFYPGIINNVCLMLFQF